MLKRQKSKVLFEVGKIQTTDGFSRNQVSVKPLFFVLCPDVR